MLKSRKIALLRSKRYFDRDGLSKGHKLITKQFVRLEFAYRSRKRKPSMQIVGWCDESHCRLIELATILMTSLARVQRG